LIELCNVEKIFGLSNPSGVQIEHRDLIELSLWLEFGGVNCALVIGHGPVCPD
jgi:hypothetical protein